jgi:hypothetical protein
LAAGQLDSVLTALMPARVALRISGLAIPVTGAISVKLSTGPFLDHAEYRRLVLTAPGWRSRSSRR